MPVNDRAAVPLMVALHDTLKNGATLPEAFLRPGLKPVTTRSALRPACRSSLWEHDAGVWQRYIAVPTRDHGPDQVVCSIRCRPPVRCAAEATTFPRTDPERGTDD